jgi:hypothetical protein
MAFFILKKYAESTQGNFNWHLFDTLGPMQTREKDSIHQS